MWMHKQTTKQDLRTPGRQEQSERYSLYIIPSLETIVKFLCAHVIHNHDTADLDALFPLRRIFEKCHPGLQEIVNLNSSFVSEYHWCDPTHENKGYHCKHEWIISLMISKGKLSGQIKTDQKYAVLHISIILNISATQVG